MFFIDSEDYQFFKNFSPMFNSPTLDNNNNQKVTKCISTGISAEKIKLSCADNV